MYVMVILFFFVYFLEIPLNDAQCIDIHHHMVSQGLHYVPGPNPCTLCICDKGSPKWCKQVLCSPPQNCKSFQVGNSCCEFKCLDHILSNSENYSETYDLALRLIASAVTAVLSLSLLFFLIHRLRQRKIRLRQNRQLSEDQRSLNSIGYITGSLGYLPGSIGYLGSGNNELEFHYDESNVHYPLWKPPGNYFPRGEAPPPYEEAVRAARAEAEMVSNHNQVNSNGAPFTFSSNRNENVSLTLVHNTHVSITPNVQQTAITSSQCNVMLHQSNNVQSVQPDVRNDIPVAEIQQNPTTNSTSVNLACGPSGASHDYVIDSSSNFLQNATLESQVDVHYENYNNAVANTAPVVTVSVKNEESFSKQALNVDFLRDRIDKGTTYATSDTKAIAANSSSLAGTSNDNNLHHSKNEVNPLSSSSSWRRDALQHNASGSKSSGDVIAKQKYLDKSKGYKMDETTTNLSSGSKASRSENHAVSVDNTKLKKCNIMMKDNSRMGKTAPGRVYDKQKSQLKSNTSEKQKDILVSESGKHRTIPQKFSRNAGALDSEMCYVNATDLGKRKQIDDEFGEHCENILKLHNVDKIRYAAEKLDKKSSEKIINGNVRNSLCAPDARSTQKGSSLGMLKGEISTHRTLPKNLRELSEAFYLNFNNSICEEMSLDCILKKTLPRSSAHTETPLSSSSHDKPLKNIENNNSQPTYSNNGTLSRKIVAQDKKWSSSTVSNSANSASATTSLNSSCYRSQIDSIKMIADKSYLNNETTEPDVERDRNCDSYHCLSPTQDDIDDYRSECENCKSLSFEDCNDEEGDLQNETMTLQRRPMEQGEEHSFYRTSLTLPSHTKKTSRSVTLNTPRESWFMAMQEMTSSSESD